MKCLTLHLHPEHSSSVALGEESSTALSESSVDYSFLAPVHRSPSTVCQPCLQALEPSLGSQSVPDWALSSLSGAHHRKWILRLNKSGKENMFGKAANKKPLFIIYCFYSKMKIPIFVLLK